MITETKIFLVAELRKVIEQKVKDCTVCIATGKSLKYQIP